MITSNVENYMEHLRRIPLIIYCSLVIQRYSELYTIFTEEWNFLIALYSSTFYFHSFIYSFFIFLLVANEIVKFYENYSINIKI